MKKVIFALMMVAATSTASFAKVNNEQTKAVVKEVAQAVKDAPAGTTYGVAEANKQRIVLNTPFGRITVNKNNDGSYSCMGMNAKLLSAKNRVYKIQTSLGTFSVNTRKGTVTKH
jgi:hypothetical protein